MCTLDFICEWWPVISLVGLILGVWIGGLTAFLIYKLVKQNNNSEKDNEIKDLRYTKSKLINQVQELEEELRLRDEDL